MLLILSAGCATTEGEPLVRESDADRLITLRDKAVTAKVISSDTAGKKYIENYLLGSAPARTRVYGKVVFRIETVMKGQVEEPELKLEREVGLYEVMATTNSFLPMIGDGYLIGFDGRPGNPRKVIFVRSPQREASLDR